MNRLCFAYLFCVLFANHNNQILDKEFKQLYDFVSETKAADISVEDYAASYFSRYCKKDSQLFVCSLTLSL